MLDIGAGDNELVKRYKNGIGVDIYDWGGGALIVKNSAKLPFPNEEFETITFLASFNHIPNKKEVVEEVNRLLKKDGQVLLTMINPLIGFIAHKFIWWGEHKKRGMKSGEKLGMRKKELEKYFLSSNFVLERTTHFFYFLNNLYVFKKKA